MYRRTQYNIYSTRSGVYLYSVTTDAFEESTTAHLGFSRARVSLRKCAARAVQRTLGRGGI